VAVTRLATDRRARVPFALVGVLLLVGASTYAAAVSTHGPSRTDRHVDLAVERASAATTGAMRSAVAEAARAAAAEPVIDPAETRYGRVLDDRRPFRDALKLRIYLALRDRLPATRYRRADVTAVASLPAATTPTELRTALDRIQLAGVENGTAVRVTVRNLSVTARRDERTVARERRTRTVVVSTPVLALHDRAMRFETRLNRDPLEGPGLGRRLTARLYPVAWARGYAQYGGAPITNVVANRHVETVTNGAVLATQRSVFGRSDPAARRGTRRATLELGVRDLVAASGADAAWARRVLPRPNPDRNASTSLPPRRGTSAPSPARRIDVDVGPIAGRALTGIRTGSPRSNRSLADVVRGAYRVEVRLRTRRRPIDLDPRPNRPDPGDGWSLADTSVSTTAEVDPATGPTPAAAADEHRFADFARVVSLERRVRWTWERGNDTLSDSATWTERYRVGVTLVGEYAPSGPAPARPVGALFERGGPLNGPNLADVPEKAATRLVDRQGGRNAVATAVADGALGTGAAVVHGDRPPALRSWTVADLIALRTDLSNVSTTVPAGRLATYTANPPAELAAELRRRRTSLLDAPGRYRGVADRARVAARAALLDASIRRLERRTRTHARTRRAFDSILGRAGIGSTETLRRLQRLRGDGPLPRRTSLPGTPPGGPIAAIPDGSPAYLTVASVGHDRAAGVPPSRSYHPLTAKNVNLFVAPYGDAADAVARPVFDRPSGARPRTAARVLLASGSGGNASVRRSRRALRASVSTAVDALQRRARRSVRNETELTRPEVHAAVSAGFDRWDDPARRTLAADNGSLAAAVAAAAVARSSGDSSVRSERIASLLPTAFADVLRTRTARVPERRVDELLTRVRDRALSRATDRIDREYLNETLGRVPVGLPVAPVPGYWYATVNVWTVSVRGAYARFALRTRRGVPTPATAIRYVRDGSTVRLDVDGDGEPERLGRDERVDFATRTAVAVAVPPARDGVGDVGGDADERSGNWPRPRCTTWAARDCPDAD
jgi:hypothetical protein